MSQDGLYTEPGKPCVLVGSYQGDPSCNMGPVWAMTDPETATVRLYLHTRGKSRANHGPETFCENIVWIEPFVWVACVLGIDAVKALVLDLSWAQDNGVPLRDGEQMKFLRKAKHIHKQFEQSYLSAVDKALTTAYENCVDCSTKYIHEVIYMRYA
jgi:hypothetical protein